jgi:type IV pilus assembly protein PilV
MSMNNTILAPNRRMKCKPRQEAGFTLLEILVAVVILSLGLLGLAGLQVSSLNNNQTAYYRSIASQQAYDMADRMRANLAGIRADDNYDNLTTKTAQGCFASPCEEEQMVTSDYFQWRTANAALLPGGGGTVRCMIGPSATCATNTAGSSRVFDITVTWIEKGMNDTGANSSDPNCPTGEAPNTRCFVTRFAP